MPTDLPLGPVGERRDRGQRRLPAGHDLPPDVPLREPVVPGGVRLPGWADRRFQLGHGRVVALYIMVTVGRGWIETLRIDSVISLRTMGGLRFNVWTSLVLFLVGLVWFVASARLRPDGRSRCTTSGTSTSGRKRTARPDRVVA